jgi:hypothetical protein
MAWAGPALRSTPATVCTPTDIRPPSAITRAAGRTVKYGLVSEAVHRKLATARLVTTWQAGAYFLVSPHDWPDLLPEIVLGRTCGTRRRLTTTP